MFDNSSEGDFNPGDMVFHPDDPGRQGRLTGKTRQQAGDTVLLVDWQDNTYGWVPGYELAKVEDSPPDHFTLLEKRQFGQPDDLRRHLTFIQLSGRLANIVYSLDTTNTDFYAYQYKPVIALLESPAKGILIADEVGLGKTIEAGLIWTELRARYDARRLLVVCPAMLCEKWRDELRNRFGVETSQLSAADLRKELGRDRHETLDGRGYVCSLQGLRPPSGWDKPETQSRGEAAALANMLVEAAEGGEPLIDLLIIDEAHYLRNPQTQSAKLGGLLRDVSEHVVLLSATPVNNREEDLFTLLQLVDPDAFAGNVRNIFPQVLAANEPLHKARELALNREASAASIKQQLEVAANHPLLGGNQQLRGILSSDIDDAYLTERANRIELANRIEQTSLLSNTVNRTRKREVQELKVVREPHSSFVPLAEDGPEWDFYRRVTEAIRNYAKERNINDGFLLAPPQRQVSSCMYAAAKSWATRTDVSDLSALLYEDQGADDLGERQFTPLIEHIAHEVLPHIDIDALYGNDSKYNAFSKVVHDYLAEYPGEKLIVFSYFKATLRYLAERLDAGGCPAKLLHGGIAETKQDIIDRFRDDPDASVLLTSEVASEGVDLQFSRIVINYDLPWNPMKVEQRIGRIDRIGQQADKIIIYNLGCAETIDHRIYDLLLNKLEIFQRTLGGMEAILGEAIEKLTSALLSKPLTQEQERKRTEDAAMAIENIRKQQDDLEQNAAQLIAHGGYILERVEAAHDFKQHITEKDIKIYVKDYLDRYCKGHEFLETHNDPMQVKITLPPATAAQFNEFIDRNRLHGQSRLAGGDSVTCRFENKVRRPGRRKEELLSQFHPLIRFISEELKQHKEVFYPLVTVQLAHDVLSNAGVGTGIFVFSAQRWYFKGLRVREHLRTRAVLLGSGMPLDADRSMELVNAAKVGGTDWLSAANEMDTETVTTVQDAINTCDIQLREDYRNTKNDRKNKNSDWVEFQVQAAERYKERSLDKPQQLLIRYRQEKNQKMIQLTEGRIRKIKKKYEMQIEKFKLKEEFTSRRDDVVRGIIRVY